jgi:hypothetical protein
MPEERTDAPEKGNRVRWHIIAILWLTFLVLVNLWVLRAELYTGASNIAGGNPPVPVLLCLTLLIPFRGCLRLNEKELLSFYILSCFSIIPLTYGGVRSFFPSLTVLPYYATPDNMFKEFWTAIPDWWAPKDIAIVRGFFEGVSGKVPWGEWLLPLSLWSLFFASLWAIGCGMSWLFAQQWIKVEKLNFPLAQMPLQMIHRGKGFFTSSLSLVGILIGALPTSLMMLTSLFKPVRRFWDLAPFFSERPLNALRPLMIFPLMEGIGFGYLVTQEVLFSVWFFYFILKFFAVITIGVFGWEVPAVMTIGDSFPFPHAQSVGGYLAVASVLIYRSWRRNAFKECKFAIYTLAIGSTITVAWMVLSGMSLAVATAYWLILSLFVATYSRIRAEAGMPYSWVYPYGAQRDFLHYVFGTNGLLKIGGVKSLVILSALFWVSRHFYLNLTGAYAIDTAKIANECSITLAELAIMSFLGMFFGLWASFITHLKAYYKLGANFLEGAPGSADYRTYVAVQDFRILNQMLNNPMPPDLWRIGFTIYGAIMTALISYLRQIFPSFPLHPLGFPLAYAYSHHCPYWFPTFTIWAIKGLILRYGGMGLYRQLIPLFLGISFGHYMMTGVVWGGILSPMLKHKWPYHFRVVFE